MVLLGDVCVCHLSLHQDLGDRERLKYAHLLAILFPGYCGEHNAISSYMYIRQAIMLRLGRNRISNFGRLGNDA